MDKILFSGCSYTTGYGFPEERRHPGLWVNLLHRENTNFKNLELVNAAVTGRSNAGIFQDVAWHLLKNKFQYAIVAWTSMPRYEFDLGLETYATQQTFIPNSPTRTHKLNGITYDNKYLDTVRDRLLSLIHLHREIQNLLYYVNCLIEISQRQNTKIFFVNAICPWDKNYFVKLENFLPEDATEFTKKEIINLKNRSDEEFFILYEKMHQEYQQTGGIQQEYWLNLYDSLRHLRIDTNSDGTHPGMESNQKYFEILNQALRQML